MTQSLKKSMPQPVSRPELAGRTAIVTGSTSGIGLGIARAFAQADMNVMLNGLGAAHEIEVTRATLEKEFDTGIAYSPADMTRPDDIAEMAEQARKLFGQVDALVNNAGIQHDNHTKDMDFSPAAIRQRWEAGRVNTLRAIERAPWRGEFDPLEGVILHEMMHEDTS